MISEEKISKFIALLITDTKQGKVKWSERFARSIDSLEGEQLLVGKVFLAEFKGKNLRLYKYSQPIQVDEFEYQERVFLKLEFIENISEDSLWCFPHYIRELFDLYETVQIKVNEIDIFFNEVVPDTESSW